MNLWSEIRSFFTPKANESVAEERVVDEVLWQRVYDARETFYQTHIGKLPNDILKIGHMFGVWPGGGLYVIPATVIGSDAFAHTTFGFTNPDMPATTSASNVEVERDELGRVTETSSRLQVKTKTAVADGKAGYGYEIMMMTHGYAEWPLWFLQWAANAEILNGAGICYCPNFVAVANHGFLRRVLRISRMATRVLAAQQACYTLPGGVGTPNGIVTLAFRSDELACQRDKFRYRPINAASFGSDGIIPISQKMSWSSVCFPRD